MDWSRIGHRTDFKTVRALACPSLSSLHVLELNAQCSNISSDQIDRNENSLAHALDIRISACRVLPVAG